MFRFFVNLAATFIPLNVKPNHKDITEPIRIDNKFTFRCKFMQLTIKIKQFINDDLIRIINVRYRFITCH